jgi:hypothetical protein
MQSKEYYIQELLKVNQLFNVDELKRLGITQLQEIYYYYLTKGIV